MDGMDDDTCMVFTISDMDGMASFGRNICTL